MSQPVDPRAAGFARLVIDVLDQLAAGQFPRFLDVNEVAEMIPPRR